MRDQCNRKDQFQNPCLASIFVMSGIDPACHTCAEVIDSYRKTLHARPLGGGFWELNLTLEQADALKARSRAYEEASDAAMLKRIRGNIKIGIATRHN